jgi:hypothetical protein
VNFVEGDVNFVERDLNFVEGDLNFVEGDLNFVEGDVNFVELNLCVLLPYDDINYIFSNFRIHNMYIYIFLLAFYLSIILFLLSFFIYKKRANEQMSRGG